MHQDLRCRHHIEFKRKMMELYSLGNWCSYVATAMNMPRNTVRQWFRIVEAIGIEEFKRDLDAYIVHWNTKRDRLN